MASIVCAAISLYLLVLFIRILMSWFPPTPGTFYQQIYDVFDSITEPVLRPIREVLPPFRMGGAMALDMSPMVVMLIGIILQRIICG
jgi:YggT family protein